MVPVSVIHQRLADEQGLTASVASVRRYVRAISRKGRALRRCGRRGRRCRREPKPRWITATWGCGRIR